MHPLRYAQLRFLAMLMAAWLLVFSLTRGLLLATHAGDVNAGFFGILSILGLGIVHDLAFVGYAALPLAAYLALCPERLWNRGWHRGMLRALMALSFFVMLFTALSEWLFWDEFGVRFNFIAVDYLVYSKEVVDNILESYPVYPLVALLVVLSVAATAGLGGFLDGTLRAPLLSRRQRAFLVAGATAAALLGTAMPGQDYTAGAEGNAIRRELAANGPYRFFAAFRNNELDYDQLYATLPDKEIGELLRRELAEPEARFLSSDPLDVRRVIDNPGEFRPLNVIVIAMESLSAAYLETFGDSRSLTPNLDLLRTQSVFFRNFYATGTRTVRGLEAITLSVPPTPGRAIVKRLGHETGYASLGRQLRARGYDCVFLYGGRGYFDNMNAFFEGNGYRVIDQTSTPNEQISFKNAWGMCDEDLYRLALREADVDHAVGTPFFLQLMTTSNHRPFTYPEGRIDIPSGYGRQGGVKYADFAIGQFLDEARNKPWFKNTVFVFVADHTSGSAGRQDLPVDEYHIPLFVYAPRILAPREITSLASQIDLPPTILGLLNMDYTSTFFGRNALRNDTAPERALIGNYQHLGLFDGRDLAILSPRQGMRRHEDALGLSDETADTLADPIMRRDIAYYQGASRAFRNGMLLWDGLEPDRSRANDVESTRATHSPRTTRKEG
jgi:phosphoglycerol transferase MdoB-like AlkP superfamily enzyme